MGKGMKEVAKKDAAGPLETVWQIKGKKYDLSKFAETHPGGPRAIMNAAAHPNGELFVESYHPDPDMVYDIITKYEVKGEREVLNPVNNTFQSKVSYSFESSGFYRKVKKAGMEALRGKVNKKQKHRSKTNLRGDDIYLFVDMLHIVFLMVAAFLMAVGSWKAAVVYGILRGACIMRIAHVASHNSLSQYSEVNQILYYASMVFSGTTPEIWSRKHVVRHHINTNEDVLDEDRMEPLKCVAKGAPFLDVHKNQHVYMFPFYMHVVMAWSFSDLLFNSARSDAGPLPYKPKEIVLNFATLLAHMFITYFLPFYFCGFFWGLLMIEINTVLSSTIFGFEFIVNHEIDGCDIFNETLAEGKPVDWGLYQTVSSADFHAKGFGAWFFNQLTGGLNLQICHHLFPGVHYRHYPALTEVIYKHCEEAGIKPTSCNNVVDAVTKHYEFLKNCSTKFATKEGAKAAAKKEE